MKNRIIIIIISLFTLISYQCKKGDDGAGPVPDAPTITDNIKTVQESGDNLITSLLAIKDTATALDSVLKVILKDNNVLSGKVTSQGISIKYKNGIIGGILLDPEDGMSIQGDQLRKVLLNPVDISSYTPTSKKTIFVNPSYTSRSDQANQILNLYNIIFPRSGYDPPVKLLDNAATIDAMTSLSDYGVVHIYSHGWAYPDKQNITEVYLMTGEAVNAVTNKKYENELTGGNISVIKIHRGDMKYWISPAFFSSKNNFLKDSTKIYGGFCFSFCGGWPVAMKYLSQAGAYSGFTWRVWSSWNAALARSLMDTLTNNTLKEPRTLDYWFTQTPTIAKQRWDEEDKLWCKIQYTGHSDLTLWTSVEISISPNPAPAKPNENIKFTAKSSSKLPSQTKYKWNFGDGSSEQLILNDSTVTHSFANEGTFPVTVKLLDQTDKQLGTASSQAIISSETVTPNFAFVNIEIWLESINSWTSIGKYHPRDPAGFALPILRDTSYSWTDTTLFGIGITRVPITMSGNSFTGYRQDTLNRFGYVGIMIQSLSGSYNSITKTASMVCIISYSEKDLANTYTKQSSITYSANGLPLYGQDPTSYSFRAEGLSSCNYTSGVTYNSVTTPIPPLGVTEEGMKSTKNLTSFFCSASSKVLIYLSVN